MGGDDKDGPWPTNSWKISVTSITVIKDKKVKSFQLGYNIGLEMPQSRFSFGSRKVGGGLIMNGEGQNLRV